MLKEFQSTLPREERPVSPIFDLQTSHFNPRSHERSDSCEMFSSPCTFYFNPRSHERSDLVMLISSQFHIFQSTLPREERQIHITNHMDFLTFQSTLPREERRKAPIYSVKEPAYFNPRSHERSDSTSSASYSF